jgi:diguanylate cyclase (GGDEF)-like protein
MMKVSETLDNEWLRQMSVSELEIADTEPEEPFDRVVRLAARVTGTKHAALSVVDGDRLVLKATVGGSRGWLDRAHTFSAQAILQRQTLIVEDALEDERFRDHPLVKQSPPGFRFYAGVPIRSPIGVHVATLCVLDEAPRRVEDDALREDMNDLARTIESELLLRSLKLRDPLTGLYNPQTFQLLADRAWRRARNAGLNASVIMAALDQPPRHSGNLVQDNNALLRRASQSIQDCCADIRHILTRDRPHRFTLLVLNEDREVVRGLAESISRALQGINGRSAANDADWPAVSVGAAHSRKLPAGDRSLIDLVERAQSALKQAREGGGSGVYML